MIYRWEEHEPRLGEGSWVAPDASVMGRVTIGKESSVWFGSVIRGDVHYVEIGDFCNIQDLSVIHVTTDTHPVLLGDYVTLGHRVTLHGCTLQNHSFVGIGATVMDGCELGEYSLLAAGSLLPPGKSVPPRMVAMGSPAKVIREITPEEEAMINHIPLHYAELKRSYLDPSRFSPVK